MEFFEFLRNSRIHAKKCPTERKSVLPSANLINRIFRKLYLEYRTLSHSRDTLHLEYPTEKTKLGIIFTDKSHRDTVMDFFQPTTIFQQKHYDFLSLTTYPWTGCTISEKSSLSWIAFLSKNGFFGGENGFLVGRQVVSLRWEM